MRDLFWDSKAWQDYIYWQSQDKKTLTNPFEGMGKPEPLKENLSGYWSRRIDETNRIVYRVTDEYIKIIFCQYHY